MTTDAKRTKWFVDGHTLGGAVRIGCEGDAAEQIATVLGSDDVIRMERADFICRAVNSQMGGRSALRTSKTICVATKNLT